MEHKHDFEVSMQPLDMAARDVVNEILAAHPQSVSEVSFTNLFAWRKARPIWFRVFDSASAQRSLVFLTRNAVGELVALGDVAGPMDAAAVVADIPAIAAWDRCSAATAEALRAAGLDVARDRDNDDYVYSVSALAELPGSKLSKKRQWVVRAQKAYPDAALEPITAESAAKECSRVLHEWCREKGCHKDPELCAEYAATHDTLMHWAELAAPSPSGSVANGVDGIGVFGWQLRLHGRIEAFAVHERLGDGVAVCHFEKANHALVGASQLLNKLVAEHLLNLGFSLVNREQDTGNAGLRTAKLSYCPRQMVEKFRVRIHTESAATTDVAAFAPTPFNKDNIPQCLVDILRDW